MMYIYNAIQTYRTKDQRPIAPPFQALPSHAEYPDYYETIKYPIDLNTIHSRIQTGHYARLDNFLYDVRLLCHNAETYNASGSLIHRDCEIIRRLISRTARELTTAASAAPTPQSAQEASRTRTEHSAGTGALLSHSGQAPRVSSLPLITHSVDRKSPVHERVFVICEHLVSLRSPDNSRYADTLFRLPA